MLDRPSSHVTLRPSSLLWTWLSSPLQKTKPLGGKRKNSDRFPCWSLGVIGWSPSVEEEGFLLETNWNNLVCWTLEALKFFAPFEELFLTSSCSVLYPLLAPGDTDCCCCSVTPQGLFGPYFFPHKNTFKYMHPLPRKWNHFWYSHKGEASLPLWRTLRSFHIIN